MNDPCIQRLRRLDVCAVSDALDKLGLAGAVTGLPLRSAGPGGNSRIAGRAITMKVAPNTVSGRVVNTSSDLPVSMSNDNRAPSDRPIQLRCIDFTRSGQSTVSRPSSS